MQVAAQHPEAEGQSARADMEERLFLHRVALHPSDVAEGDHEPAALVEPHLTDTEGSLRNGTTVPTGEAPHLVPLQLLVKVALNGLLLQDLSQARHGSKYLKS